MERVNVCSCILRESNELIDLNWQGFCLVKRRCRPTKKSVWGSATCILVAWFKFRGASVKSCHI